MKLDVIVATVASCVVFYRARTMGSLEFWFYLAILAYAAVALARGFGRESFQVTGLAELPGAVTSVLGPAFDGLIKVVKGSDAEEENILTIDNYTGGGADDEPQDALGVPLGENGKPEEEAYAKAFDKLKKEYTALNASLLAVKKADETSYTKIMSALKKKK